MTTREPNRPSPRPTRLACETLEPRENPAGNMAAFFNNFGELIIWGDALDNAVSVQQNALGDVFIFGVNGTLINGQTAIFLGRAILNGLHIDAGFGNDLIEVLGVQTPGTIGINGNFGNDGIHASGVLGTTVITAGSAGNDVVTTTNVFARSLAWVDGGAGSDILDYNGVFGPQVVVGFEAII